MTWHIHIKGQVQGIGFRPFVYNLAKKYKLEGWVNNAFDGVHIELNADANLAGQFKSQLLKNAPELGIITAIDMYEIEDKNFKEFQIIHSEKQGKANLLLTPDIGLCTYCRKELSSHKDIRYDYPFITCTSCGPRYSIVEKLPYDRVYTTMDIHEMCPRCMLEFCDPENRRYYSQTNTCPNCSIQLSLVDHNLDKISTDTHTILDSIVSIWNQGKIVAIKGIGGYLLTCDAGNGEAIRALRKRKHRPSKPFALMYPSIEDLSAYQLSNHEIENLKSPVSPIVILNLKEKSAVSDQIAPKLNQVGVMLPYAPIFELLLSRFKKPIVATSGNISNAPIVYKDGIALQELVGIADYILANNREIVIPQDDSVIKFTTWGKHQIIFRRSRGLAPTYINKKITISDETILAMGSMLKGTFSLFHFKNTYISQYLGDLQNYNTQQCYKLAIEHFLKVFQARPTIILCDKHEDYPSTQFGYELVKGWKIPIQLIQHHQAHFGAVLGEHGLLDAEDAILGIIWDGTGLGNDGQIWGGEFFKYEHYDFLRCYHFDYFDYILGDKMPREPRISALSACWGVKGVENLLEDKFTKTEWQIYTKLLSKENILKTSSVGRLFDAVASLLGLMDKQTYEGEAAMILEATATSYFKLNGLDFSESYFEEDDHFKQIPTKSLMGNIIRDLQSGKSKVFIAAKFHYSLTQLIKIVANECKIVKIAFSGGVFQNSLLVDLINFHLDGEFELFFHMQLSPNDENISFGQQICYLIDKQKEIIATSNFSD